MKQQAWYAINHGQAPQHPSYLCIAPAAPHVTVPDLPLRRRWCTKHARHALLRGRHTQRTACHCLARRLQCCCNLLELLQLVVGLQQQQQQQVVSSKEQVNCLNSSSLFRVLQQALCAATNPTAGLRKPVHPAYSHRAWGQQCCIRAGSSYAAPAALKHVNLPSTRNHKHAHQLVCQNTLKRSLHSQVICLACSAV
jgi:hypothetical protein